MTFHGHRASTPLGPAAGPQSQMAQNLVLSWLAGCRIMELKTVQILDELEIPRPCIDMQTVGYNVEWSQELKLEESLEEYVKGSMLIEMLRASGVVPMAGGFDDVVYDMSVGYDLAGIKTPKNLDGVSFAPTLRGEKKKQAKHDHLYWEFHEQGGKQAIRKGKWKAVRLNVRKNPDGPIQLYDLSNDLGETKNLAAKHPDLIKEMARLMSDSHIANPSFRFLPSEK